MGLERDDKVGVTAVARRKRLEWVAGVSQNKVGMSGVSDWGGFIYKIPDPAFFEYLGPFLSEAPMWGFPKIGDPNITP